jgi:predicted MFS family arabinose efflux permease
VSERILGADIAPAFSWSGVRRIIVITGAIQFFVALEGSMLFPLGPILSMALHFDPRHLGYLNGAFLTAAALSGIAGAFFIDRFERRTALATMLGALAICTGLAGLSTDLETLLIFRFAAGIVGGPAMATGLALIADTVPVHVRGRAVAFVTLGHAVAIIMGVPISMQLAAWFGWKANFFIIGTIGFGLAIAALLGLPRSVATQAAAKVSYILADFGRMLRWKATPLAIVSGTMVSATSNMLAANLAPFFVYNLGFPAEKMGWVWMCGGFFGLAGAQGAGNLADRIGAVRVFFYLSVLTVGVFAMIFLADPPPLPVVLLFCSFSFCSNSRMVLVSVINSMVPPPGQRGRFLSLATAFNQAGSAVALVVASKILGTNAAGGFSHVAALGWIAIAATVVSPILATRLKHSIKPN